MVPADQSIRFAEALQRRGRDRDARAGARRLALLGRRGRRARHRGALRRASSARSPRGSPDQVMPIHTAMSSRFPLLESVPSMQALMEDPAYAQLRAQFEAHPDYQVPEVSVRSAQVPGPHGAVPVRVYGEPAGTAATARAWSGCTAAASSPGTWTCPRPTGPRASWPCGPARWWSASTTGCATTACTSRSRTTTWWPRSAGSAGAAPRTWASTRTGSRSAARARARTWRQAPR